MSPIASPTLTALQSAKQVLRRHYTLVRKSLPAWRREEARVRLPQALSTRLETIDGLVLSFVTIGSEIQTDLLNEVLGNRLLTPELKGAQISLDQLPELVIVPGIAFDRNHHRIGYGMGCYDRFLAEFEHIPTCGIGFQEQLSHTPLPTEAHDMPLHEMLLL